LDKNGREYWAFLAEILIRHQAWNFLWLREISNCWFRIFSRPPIKS
jgi:hypothetical protein